MTKPIKQQHQQPMQKHQFGGLAAPQQMHMRPQQQHQEQQHSEASSPEVMSPDSDHMYGHYPSLIDYTFQNQPQQLDHQQLLFQQQQQQIMQLQQLLQQQQLQMQQNYNPYAASMPQFQQPGFVNHYAPQPQINPPASQLGDPSQVGVSSMSGSPMGQLYGAPPSSYLQIALQQQQFVAGVPVLHVLKTPRDPNQRLLRLSIDESNGYTGGVGGIRGMNESPFLGGQGQGSPATDM